MKDIKEIEELLKVKGQKISELDAPQELESRLINALETSRKTVKKEKGSFNWVSRVAVIFLVAILIGYNFNTLAFYGKKLMGFDTLMTGSLKELNELGRGQTIGESHTFENGASVILDGVMIDGNQLLAFYTIKDPSGNVDKLQITPNHYIKGFAGKHYMKHGRGEMNEEKTEVKCISSYQAPRLLERTLELSFTYQGEQMHEEASFSFKIDREKAMKYTLKKSINKTIRYKETKLYIDAISASPTNTIINGSLQNTIELVKDHISGERMRPKAINISLIANGEAIQPVAAGMSTNLKGISFHHEFEALPKDLKSLELRVNSVSIDHDAKAQYRVNLGAENKALELMGQKIEINNVVKTSNNTQLTITTLDETILSKVLLLINGERVALEKTITEDIIKSQEGDIYHKRTLIFPRAGDEYELIIESITFTENYNRIINIPLD